jgi:hypothetical protein
MPTLVDCQADISQRQRKPAATMDRRCTVTSKSIAVTVAEEAAYAAFRMQVRPCPCPTAVERALVHAGSGHSSGGLFVGNRNAHPGTASPIRSEFLEAEVNPGHAMIRRRLFRSPGMLPVLHAQEP